MKRILVATALAAFALNAPDFIDRAKAIPRMSKSWEGRPFRSSGAHVDAVRTAVSENVPQDEKLFLVCRNGGSLSSTERALHIGLVFDRPMTPVDFGNFDQWPREIPGLVPEEWKGRIDKGSFRLLPVQAPGAWVLAIPEATPPIGSGNAEARESARSASRCLREVAGFLPFLAVCAAGWAVGNVPGLAVALVVWSLFLLACCFAGLPSSWTLPWTSAAGTLAVVGFAFKKNRGRAEPGRWNDGALARRLCVSVFSVFSGGLALAHSLMPPNGLGTVGGRARMLWEHGGFPERFFTAASFATQQPAYPPGAALLRYGMACASGECGEWLSQLTTVFAGAVLVHAILRRRPVYLLPFLAAVATLPVFLKMSAADYPDVFAGLFAVVGWELIRKSPGGCHVGWFLLGSAGFFKTEGLVVALSIWTGEAVSTALEGPADGTMFGKRIGRLLVFLLECVALPSAWHVGVRLAGGGFNDFAPLCETDAEQMRIALWRMARLAFGKPWQYAFDYPLAIAFLAFDMAENRNAGREKGERKRKGRPSHDGIRVRETSRALAATVLCLFFYSVIYGCSRAPDFEWHLSTSLTRLLWLPAVLLGLGIARDVEKRLASFWRTN